MMGNDVSLIAILAFSTILPILIAAGTCFIKFSIVFSLIRNAIGLQQVPSNLTLQSIAFLMTAFVMMPVASQTLTYFHTAAPDLSSVDGMNALIENGLGPYRDYLARFADPKLVQFFSNLHVQQAASMADQALIGQVGDGDAPSLFALLPAYALSEIKSAFEIGFYVYLRFIVIDLIVSNVLLALGMMMMSPITIALPIKLILFVAVDGWTKVTESLILQYKVLWS